jgi:LSD1 subclass zinc finger protein
MRNGSLPVRNDPALVSECIELSSRIRVLEKQVRLLNAQLSGAAGYLRCSICHTTKHESEFWRDRSYRMTGHRTSCKACERAKGRQWSVRSSV